MFYIYLSLQTEAFKANIFINVINVLFHLGNVVFVTVWNYVINVCVLYRYILNVI